MVQARLACKTSWKKLKLQAMVTCMEQEREAALACPGWGSMHPAVWECSWVAWTIKPEISSRKRNFPVGADTRYCVSHVTWSLANSQLVWSSLKSISAPVTPVRFFLPFWWEKPKHGTIRLLSQLQGTFSPGVFCPAYLGEFLGIIYRFSMGFSTL